MVEVERVAKVAHLRRREHVVPRGGPGVQRRGGAGQTQEAP